MAKPSIKSILPIDALVGGEISASYAGDLPYSNKLVIYLASDLSVVYTNTTTTHALSHTVPANILTNGERYCATIQFFDDNGVASSVSDKTYFYAYKTPSWSLVGITDNTTIQNAELGLVLSYSQVDGEPLNSYQFILYTADKVALSSSEIMYDVTDLTYTFKGLENRTTYYVQAKGETSHGISCDTGLLKIFVDYKNPTSYSRIYADSDINGTVNGYTNIIIIEPVDADPDHYVFDNGFINLENQQVEYNKAYTLTSDFVVCLKEKKAVPEKDMLVVSNIDNHRMFKISSHMYNDKIFFKLTVDNPICNYILYSNRFNYTENTVYTIWVKRINNIYDINVVV